MIQIVSKFATDDGKTFDTEAQAKAHELAVLMPSNMATGIEAIGAWIVENGQMVIDVLERAPGEKPKAPRKPRADRGKPHKKPQPQLAHSMDDGTKIEE